MIDFDKQVKNALFKIKKIKNNYFIKVQVDNSHLLDLLSIMKEKIVVKASLSKNSLECH